MSHDTPVIFDGVWKKFRLGEWHNSFRDLLPALVMRPFRRQPPSELNKREFWAVRDVSFEVKRGQALGIIGPNGAGKSTTLKMLTKILRPTRGRSVVHGRVGALIEVAAGFHPDLTGRENIYLQGAIMGMRQAEIARKLDEIIEFAGVSGFIDTQVKRYSSGMNARLGFAIAANLDPDVLIIDEVLSVGDMSFQRKCVDRMERFKRDGVAIVFVSHNLQAVARLCDQALFLKSEVMASGDSEHVLQAYSADSQKVAAVDTVGDVVLEDAKLLTSGEDGFHVPSGSQLTLRVTFLFKKGIPEELAFGFTLHRSTDLLVVYDSNESSTALGMSPVKAGDRVTLDFEFAANLTRGMYHVECFVHHNPTQAFLGKFSPVATFVVEELRTQRGIANVALTTRLVREAVSVTAGYR